MGKWIANFPVDKVVAAVLERPRPPRCIRCNKLMNVQAISGKYIEIRLDCSFPDGTVALACGRCSNRRPLTVEADHAEVVHILALPHRYLVHVGPKMDSVLIENLGPMGRA